MTALQLHLIISRVCIKLKKKENNWLFTGTPDGAHASATIYSLIETAKANKLDVYRYLRYLLEILPLAKNVKDLRKLLPTVFRENQIPLLPNYSAV